MPQQVPPEAARASASAPGSATSTGRQNSRRQARAVARKRVAVRRRLGEETRIVDKVIRATINVRANKPAKDQERLLGWRKTEGSFALTDGVLPLDPDVVDIVRVAVWVPELVRVTM